ncbi:hypothetical protein PISMIDRAFT_685469 [Pisolithus microcarpus 441]|uniref:Unplaced genomic scaffold scaffold_151, whole genome shotgun sequence n=1 Tax=Pisolithus microcarpus 441 TaxID=765257 RepID=A0A0C9YKL5_9AGAM|nr:hypothetical protein PISMIDRAFT_685469 [Pisolithus microcarpus 441]
MPRDLDEADARLLGRPLPHPLLVLQSPRLLAVPRHPRRSEPFPQHEPRAWQSAGGIPRSQ